MSTNKILKVVIFGATGFTGEKLVELLLKHPSVRITYLSAKIEKDCYYSDLFPKFKGKIDLICEKPNIKKAKNLGDIFFLALPHTVSMRIVPYLLEEDKKVIDLSADYRLKNTKLYKEYYKINHTDKRNLKKATYGLVEFFKNKIKESKLIANPGCYPISTILPLAPLLKEDLIDPEIIIDSKSSITGAGRKPAVEYHYSNISNNLWAYKPFIHQHTPEIVEVLKRISNNKEIKLNFIPHVVGIEVGIYSTIHINFKRRMTTKSLIGIYNKYYKTSPFVRVRVSLPKLKDVTGTNFCDIGFYIDKSRKRAVICSCIDNLIKGASGNAIQNMNVMCGFKETEGLL
ncbi:MAG: N-acetyl-gamma-glutamyl-phosphate reductase [Candidatus Omnitrophota bacterium]|nr:MAG: N-acetyl-gamma-glutamyl-phosphate reductase [Candidatus Omnitrophota bacterium]